MIVMKKIISLLLCMGLLLSMAGCGGSSQNASNSSNNAAQEDPANKIDHDLSGMSGTVVFAQVSNMLTNAGDYIGKTVRIKGNFAVYQDTNTGQLYFACVIPDATACCEQGFEFVLSEQRTYPQEYPEIGTQITVTGIFSTYQEGQFTYVTLKDAKLM